MSHDGYVPLSQRRGHAPRFEVITGVPEFLRTHLTNWLNEAGTITEDHAIDLGLTLRINVDRVLDWCYPADAIVDALGTDQVAWLDAIDWLLAHHAVLPDKLRRILDLAGHELTVAPDGKSLIERIDPASLKAFEFATEPSDAASTHLNEAWTLTFGRNPRPGEGWGQG